MNAFYNFVNNFGTLGWVLTIAWYILLAAGLWRVFEKAGESGWKAIIPIYNLYILFKITWNTRAFWGYLLVTVISTILLIYGYGNAMMFYLGTALSIVEALMIAVLWYNVSLAYGHGIGYFLGLYFLNPIFIMILGFGKSEYIGNRYSAQSHARI